MLAISCGRGSETSRGLGSPHSSNPDSPSHLLWDLEKHTSFSGPHFLICKEVHQSNSNHLTESVKNSWQGVWSTGPAGSAGDKESCCSHSSGSLPGSLHPQPPAQGKACSLPVLLQEVKRGGAMHIPQPPSYTPAENRGPKLALSALKGTAAPAPAGHHTHTLLGMHAQLSRSQTPAWGRAHHPVTLLQSSPVPPNTLSLHSQHKLICEFVQEVTELYNDF